MAIGSRTFDSVRSYLGSFTWGPFVKLSRSTVLGLLSKIEIGQLIIKDADGTVTICGRTGEKNGAPCTELRVLKEAFWVRLMLFADMVGFEHYSHQGREECLEADGMQIRASLRASCWARFRVQISFPFSGYVDTWQCHSLWWSLIVTDLHPEPCSAVECHNSGILPCVDSHRPRPEHEHHGKFPIECLRPLRHQQCNVCSLSLQ